MQVNVTTSKKLSSEKRQAESEDKDLSQQDEGSEELEVSDGANAEAGLEEGESKPQTAIISVASLGEDKSPGSKGGDSQSSVEDISKEKESLQVIGSKAASSDSINSKVPPGTNSSETASP